MPPEATAPSPPGVTPAPVATPAPAPKESAAPAKSPADAEEDRKWQDIKAEARARGIERGHRKPDDKPEAKAEPKAKETKETKEAKPEPSAKADAGKVRDEKGRFVPSAEKAAAADSTDKPAEKPVTNGKAVEKSAQTAEETKPEEPKPEPKRPQRTDAEINASFARLKRERRESDARASQLAERETKLEARERELAEDSELRSKDPYGWLEKHKFDLVDVARETKKRSEMTPAELASSDLSKQLAAMKSELEELKKNPPRAEPEKELHELPEAQVFIDKVATAHEVLSPDAYPFLSQEDGTEVGKAALELDHQQWLKTKKHLDLRSIFRILEGNLKQAQPQPTSAAPNEEAGNAGAIRTESENGGPTDTGKRPPAVNHSLSARTTAKVRPERGSREAAIAKLDSILRS